MATKTAQDAKDTGLSDADDTSTNVDDQDTDAEAELEGDDTSWTDVDDDETEDESADADLEEEATDSDDDTEEEAADDAEEEADPNEETADDSTTDEDADAATTTAADKRKRDNEAAQRRMADRDAARIQAKQDAQQLYLDAAENEDQLAIRQVQVDSYNNRVMMVQNSLHGNLNSAVSQIDLFQSKDPSIREAMLEAVDDYDRMYVVKDQHGDPIEVKGDVLQFLQKRADTIRKLTGLGAKKQDTDKKNQKKRTVTPPNRTPKKAKTDPDLDAFDAEANK